MIHRIGVRIVFFVGLVAAAGLSAVIFLYAAGQERSIREQNERALIKVTHSVGEGLQAVMLRGYADIGHRFAERLKHLRGTIDYRVMRLDGREAFVDNATIDRVNARLGELRFLRRPALDATLVLSPDAPAFRALASSRQRQLYYETLPDGRQVISVLEPIRFDEACGKCHADGQAIRGVLKLTRSLSDVEQDIRTHWLISVGSALAGVLLVGAAVYLAAQQSVVRPIRAVTQAMSEAAQGDLSVRVPITGRDEIGDMAASFNRMSARLHEVYAELQDEQGKLSAIIFGAREGIVLTDAKGAVVLVNQAATELLDKSEHQVVEHGFLGLVDDPDWMRDRLGATDEDGRSGIVTYRRRILAIHVSTMRGADGAEMGSAAIIRDVTDEKRLEQELRQLAHTDALTGLGNRHRFDEAMGGEFDRARRYGTGFALLLVDVDHFKGFNDRHGHDCGDRVLRALAAVIERRIAGQGVCCRFGGEEIAIVLPDQDLNGALAQAESLRAAIEQQSVDGLRVTASFGVAVFQAGMAAPAELVAAADQALYRAKAAGRNRVEAAPN